jgi:YD repeat-containing protein
VPPGGGSPMIVADNLEYLPFGPASHLELGPVAGRVVEERGHDWQYRRTGQTAVGPGSTGLLDLEYDYDAAGNLIMRTDHLGDRTAGYGYDDLSRLTGASWTDGNRVYDYDTIGNLERLGVDEGLTGEGEVLFGYAANPAGGNLAILESTETRQGGSPLSSYVVESDDIGNVTSDGLTTFDYNEQNHLGSRALKGVTVENTYSADGRLARSARSDTGAATDIVLDAAGRRLAKLEGGAWRDYVYLGDQLLTYFDGGADDPVQVLADHIGMPIMAVDGTGAVVWQALAEPYGELRGEVGLSTDPGLRYPGQWQDELDLEADCVGDMCTVPGPLDDSFSLFENGYRWYVPRWGRYGQADPIMAGGVGTGLYKWPEVFAYSGSAPQTKVDEFGLFPSSFKEIDACIQGPCGIRCDFQRAENRGWCKLMFGFRNVNVNVLYSAEVVYCQRSLLKIYTAWRYPGCLEKARTRRDALLEKVSAEYDRCMEDANLIYAECMRNFDCDEPTLEF